MDRQPEKTDASENDLEDRNGVIAESADETNPLVDSEFQNPMSDVMEEYDGEFDDDGEFEDEFDKPVRKRRHKRRLFCFSCNRPEGHFLFAKRRWFYSFFLGLTFGLAVIVGPYQCQCCGSARLMRYDALNLRYWARAKRGGKLDNAKKRFVEPKK